MKKFYLLVFALLISIFLNACSLLPKPAYTSINRYDFGLISSHALKNINKNIKVTLHGVHPSKLVFRVNKNQIKYMEYMRWSFALDDLMTDYLSMSIKCSADTISLKIYNWEYDVQAQKVVAVYLLDTSASQQVLKQSVSVVNTSQQGIINAFTELIQQVSKQINTKINCEKF